MDDRATHWNQVYSQKTEDQLSWHEDQAALSLELTRAAGITASSSVIDIGGGTSRYADALLALGLRDVTVLDISPAALSAAQARLGQAGDAVSWIAADITAWSPDRRYDLWHDRAVFHFLVDPADRAAYLRALSDAVAPGGHAIIATFAPDGPEACSGLPVRRYSPDELAEVLGPRFSLTAHRHHVHRTPWGKDQSFQFSLFGKTG